MEVPAGQVRESIPGPGPSLAEIRYEIDLTEPVVFPAPTRDVKRWAS
jgi:hypothetical protein